MKVRIIEMDGEAEDLRTLTESRSLFEALPLLPESVEDEPELVDPPNLTPAPKAKQKGKRICSKCKVDIRSNVHREQCLGKTLTAPASTDGSSTTQPTKASMDAAGAAEKHE